MNKLNNFFLGVSFQLLVFNVVGLAFAQSVRVDGTTPTSPQVCIDSCTITGGVERGKNIFHSFFQFNVGLGQKILFSGRGFENVFGRVTGPSMSLILGELGVTGGNANLFLLNPNGILFGPNSKLNLSGSFIATTANSIQFKNQGSFSSTSLDIPLLNINPSALLFILKPNPITVQSRAVVDQGFSKGRVREQPTPFGLKVPNGKSLLLVGGNVSLDGGGLNAFGGRLELGGLANPGSVEIVIDSGNPSLRFPNNIILSDISISNKSQLNVSADVGGDIAINSENLDISDRSFFLAGVAKEMGSSDNQSGDIFIRAQNKLRISNSIIENTIDDSGIGRSGDIYFSVGDFQLENNSRIRARVFGIGDSGDILIRTKGKLTLKSNSRILNATGPNTLGNSGGIKVRAQDIELTGASRIGSFAFGLGKVGDVTLSATDLISLSSDSRVGSSIVAKDLKTLKRTITNPIILKAINDPTIEEVIKTPGTVTIDARVLSLSEGAQIANFATGSGIGVGGDIFVNTTDSVVISGFSQVIDFPDNPNFPDGRGFSSGLFTFARDSTTGPAGNITVKTRDFRITGGGAVSSQTFNGSPGGDISISANNFLANTGGQIRTTASSSGDAGDITLKIRDKLILSGSDPNFDRRLTALKLGLTRVERLSDEQAKAEINLLREIGANSGLFANSTSQSSGLGGNINIDPQLVLIEDGAQISVNSEGVPANNIGLKSSGSITLRSGNLVLNRGTISATSKNNSGGDITLLLRDLLSLRNNSSISTTASGNGTGGNININSSFIVAAPTENSDITANAFNGRGGQILVNTKGIIGLKVRTTNTNFSDITAFSKNNPRLNGNVIVNTPETDPTDNLSEQPEVVEPPQEIAKGCRPGQTLGGSTFTNVGRGGLPLSPQQTQTPTNVWQDLRSHNLQPTTISSTDPSPTSLIPTPPPSITEAKGWTKDTQGRIYLTANVLQPNQTPQPIATC